jgi:hypothetical protein
VTALRSSYGLLDLKQEIKIKIKIKIQTTAVVIILSLSKYHDSKMKNPMEMFNLLEVFLHDSFFLLSRTISP